MIFSDLPSFFQRRKDLATNLQRLVLAYVAAAVIGALLSVIVTLGVSDTSLIEVYKKVGFSDVLLSVSLYAITWLCGLVFIGAPVWFVLHLYGYRSAGHLILTGAIVLAIVTFSNVLLGLQMALVGAVIGWIMWWVGYKALRKTS